MPEYFVEQRFRQGPRQGVLEGRLLRPTTTKTIQLVQSGAYQVGAVDFSVWGLELKAGHVDTSKVKVIWTSPPFPDYQWTVRGELDKSNGEGFTKKLQDALIASRRSSDPRTLRPIQVRRGGQRGIQATRRGRAQRRACSTDSRGAGDDGRPATDRPRGRRDWLYRTGRVRPSRPDDPGGRARGAPRPLRGRQDHAVERPLRRARRPRGADPASGGARAAALGFPQCLHGPAGPPFEPVQSARAGVGRRRRPWPRSRSC